MMKATSLTKDLVPIDVPFIVKNGFGIAALAALLTFPMFVPVHYFFDWLQFFLAHHGLKVAIPMVWEFLSALMLCVSVPMLLGFSRTSTFILQLVRYHLDHDDPERAKKIAASLSYQVWYREYRKNEWYRSFLEQCSLDSEDTRYAGFKKKYGT
jgi:hypothetical protein